MDKFARWFNNSQILSWLLTPWSLKEFWRGYQRIRICENCHHITKKIHWAKDDRECEGKMIYSHTYFCDFCFYHFGR